MHRHHRRAWRHGCDPDFMSGGFDGSRRDRAYSSRREEEAVFGSAGLGGRRPLRFLAYRLEMSRDQVHEASRVLERLRIEREQAAVDLRRASADIADAIDNETFDVERAEAASAERVEVAGNVRRAVTTALKELHELLDDDQRTRLAMLVRSRSIRL